MRFGLNDFRRLKTLLSHVTDVSQFRDNFLVKRYIVGILRFSINETLTDVNAASA